MPNLVSHPDFPPRSNFSVRVDNLVVRGEFVLLCYKVDHAQSIHFREIRSGRQDNLWKSTCFELFLRSRTGDDYIEFNFAPPLGWAAYAFDEYRKGRRPLELVNDPHLVDSRIDDRQVHFPARYELDVILRPADLLPALSKLALSAVIEETDGTKSYWALRHPPGPPDFHHPDCFQLTLPAPEHP